MVSFFKKYTSLLIVFIFSSILTFLCFLVVLERQNYINSIKLSINKLDTSLYEMGYIMSYDSIDFHKFSPINLLTVKGLKINKINKDENSFSWNAPEINVGFDIFSLGGININFSNEQYIRNDNISYNALIPDLKVSAKFNKEAGLTGLSVFGRDIVVDNFIQIKELKFSAQRKSAKDNNFAPYFTTMLQAEDILFSNDLKVKDISLNTDILGVFKSFETYDKSLHTWLAMGGMLDIKELLLNTNEMKLLGRGDLYFDENLYPHLHLSTSSQGMFDMVNMLEEREMLDGKGAFVAKMRLNSKGFFVEEGDKSKTLTAPIDIDYEGISLENATIKKFGQGFQKNAVKVNILREI